MPATTPITEPAPASERAALPPGPPLPSILQLAAWAIDPTRLLETCERRYGKAFTVRLPGDPPLVVVSSHEAIRQVFTAPPDVVLGGRPNWVLRPLLGTNSLLLLDGADHVRHRKLLLPRLHGERLNAYTRGMRDAAHRALDAWPLGTPFNAVERCRAIALEVVLRVVFGLDPAADRGGLGALVGRLSDEGMTPLLRVPWLQRDLGRWSPWGRFRSLVRATDAALHAEIARRRAEGGGVDVLALLLEARDEDGRGLTDAEIRDELITLLVAGHETTATTIAWALAEVLMHPDVGARLDDEARATVGPAHEVESEHVPRLEYLDAVVRETLRLHAIVPAIGRVLAAPLEVAGWRLPAGVQVVPCVHLAQRDPAAFPEPTRFRPERFVGAKPDPYAWLPFGGGARRCVGMSLALHEIKVVLATLRARGSFRLAPRPSHHPRLRGVTIVPADGVRLVLESRRPRAAGPG